MTEKLPVSVSVISFNEEAIVEKMLASVAPFASQIVVVDSHSTDATRDIAERFGADVFEEDWKGHIAQKNSALEKCNGEWILALDCDEVVTDELAASIRRHIESDAADGGVLNRRTFYLGKLLKHSWQPDRKLRLVRRSKNPRWGGYDPHDVLSIEGTTAKLDGDLIHYSYKDIADHMRKMVGHARVAAVSYAKQGRTFSLFKLLVNPPATFIKKYIIKGGFLDGLRGFMVAVSSVMYTFLKYMFLWEETRFKKGK